jgi:hypothetical protein
MMQIIAVDPFTMILFGLGIAIVFMVVAIRSRPSLSPRFGVGDDIGTMAGDRIEQITTGRLQEPTPAHLVSVEEEEEEFEENEADASRRKA